MTNYSTAKVRNGTANAPSVSSAEPELELMQPHMAQKPVLRGEVKCFFGRAKLSPARTPGSLERRTQEPKKPPDEQRRGCAPRGHQSGPRAEVPRRHIFMLLIYHR